MVSDSLPESSTASRDHGSASSNTLVDNRPDRDVHSPKHRLHQRKHGDHYDTLNTGNPWTFNEIHEDNIDFNSDWVRMCEDSVSNEELYTERTTQAWLQTLANLSRQNIRAFYSSLHDIRRQCIPLFEAEDGDEYQISLWPSTSLADITCPTDFRKATSPLMMLRSRISVSLDDCKTPIPKLVIQLGYLEVRTSYRLPGEDPDTEMTDYSVMVDVEHEDMPVWLFVSRQQLKDRMLAATFPEPILPLPVFRGLMQDEEKTYDTACILPSIRQLCTAGEATKTMFSEVCERVRATRCIVDPVVFVLPDDQFVKFEAGEPLDNPGPTADLGYSPTEERLFPESILRYIPPNKEKDGEKDGEKGEEEEKELEPSF